MERFSMLLLVLCRRQERVLCVSDDPSVGQQL